MTRMLTGSRALAAGVALLAAGATASAADYTVQPDESMFGVILHKAGIGSALAHNHFIVAGEYETRLALDPDRLDDAEFRLELRAEDLVVDHPERAETWWPRIETLGLLDNKLPRLDESTRSDIRDSMLGEGQLHAEEHPTITAELRGIDAGKQTVGEVSFSHVATVALTVRGKTVEKAVAVRIEQSGEDGAVAIEGVGAFRFTDFDIKPYSAFFGAVRNKDRFHVFVHLRAIPAGEQTVDGE